jgi:hypothetical protein
MKMLFALSLALLTTVGACGQGLIWSTDHWADNNSVLPGASWQIAFDHVSGPTPAPRIFSMTFVTNDSGRTFFANALNEPDFSGFVSGLTDGANNTILFQFPFASQIWSERDFLGRSAAAPDLAGYNITQIGFRVNTFYDRYFAPDDTYFRRLDYSLDFYGVPVPEPSTCALLILGGGLFWFLRRAPRS